jgi:hypothetical protein
VLHRSHNFIERGLLHYRLGIGRHDISDVGSVRVDIIGRQAALAEKELQPAGLASLRSSFSATQKISFRHPAVSSTGRPLIRSESVICVASNTEESSFTDSHHINRFHR